MAIYLDTSCLLKVFFSEPESDRTIALLEAETSVLVSSLARLEALSQIHARVAGGLLTPARARRMRKRFEAVMALAPYEAVACPADVFDIAISQVAVDGRSGYCRTLDRLHLAAMQALGLRRLMTNDDVQAAAAKLLGYDVLLPRSAS